MMYVIGIFLIIGFADLGELTKENKKKEKRVVVGIMTIAFILASLYALGYKIPSPLMALDKLFRDVLGLSY